MLWNVSLLDFFHVFLELGVDLLLNWNAVEVLMYSWLAQWNHVIQEFLARLGFTGYSDPLLGDCENLMDSCSLLSCYPVI